jgi:hypothetical protein
MKYDVAPLRDQMLDVLRHAWPQYLFDWDYLQKRTEDLEKVYLRQESFDLSFAHPEPGMSMHTNHLSPRARLVSNVATSLARTVRLAMDHNVLDILPVVFYDLVRVHEVIAPNPHERFRRADLSVLTAEDLRRLMQGRGALRGKFLDGINNLLILLPHDDCKRVPVPGKPSPCHASLKKWWNAQLGAVSGPSVADPIGWLREKVVLCDDIPHDEVCGGCTRVVKRYLQAVREDLWASLPDFFGLVSTSIPRFSLVLTALTRIEGFTPAQLGQRTGTKIVVLGANTFSTLLAGLSTIMTLHTRGVYLTHPIGEKHPAQTFSLISSVLTFE